MGATGEMLKQKIGIGSGFQPTQNDRTKRMYKELTTHAKLIKGMQKNVRKLEKATDGMLTMCEKAFTAEQPHDYEATEVTKTKAEVQAVSVGVMTDAERQSKTAEIEAIRGELSARLEQEVFAPTNAWLGEVTAAKVDLKALEDTRLDLDAQRRRAGKAEFKQVKQARNLGDNTTSFKERTSAEKARVDELRTKFESEEREVYTKLKDLVVRSNVIFDCMEKAFGVGNEVMNKAQACAPSGSAMAEHAFSTPLPNVPTTQHTEAAAGDRVDAEQAPHVVQQAVEAA